MNTHFDDVKKEALSLPSKEREALADLLNKERDQAVDVDPEQVRIPLLVGPHPLYYTHHYNKMIKPNGYTVTGVAKETKKSKTVIRDGLRLKELSGVARKALRDSKINKSIGALIVTIPDKKQQDKFAKEVLTGGQHGEPMSVRKAKEWKQQHYMKELKGAPFPLDQQIDPSWPHSCLTCPHFNGNTPERRQGKRSDICLNPPHYKEQERLYEMRVSAKTKE